MLTRPISTVLTRPLGGYFVGGGYDAATVAFILASGVENQSLTDPLDDLVVALKASALWNRGVAIYPFIGGSAFAHSLNLLNPVNSNLGKRIVWSGGLTHDFSGVLPNGTSGYGDTKINPNEDMAPYSFCGAIYTPTATTPTGSHALYGLAAGSNANCDLQFTTSQYAYCASGSDAATTSITDGGNSNFSGLWAVSAYHKTNHKLYRNGVELASNTNTRVGYLPDLQVERRLTLYLGARNFVGTANTFSSYKISFAYFGLGLDATMINEMNTAVQAYQSALGRA